MSRAQPPRAPFQPTPGRPCPHYPDCVACPLIGRPYGAQLEHKRALTRQALDRYPSLAAVEVPEVIGSPRSFGYRNQAKLVARQARRGLLLGVYRPGSHQVIDIRHCPNHHEIIESLLSSVAALLEDHRVPAYDERTARGDLRYLVVRISNWRKVAQVILVTRTKTLPHERDLVRDLMRMRGVVSVVQNVNPDPGNVILGEDYRVLAGDDRLTEKINGLRLQTRAGAFLQVNTNVAGRMYRQAAEWAELTAGEAAIDLYCGAGALSFHLASQARLVVGIEASTIAVGDAKVNVRLNGLDNVRFVAGDVADALPRLAGEIGPVAVISLNPPRKGAALAAREAILAAAPRRILYVSCDPETLARDLDWFLARGYRCSRMQPYDMFPQTEHVESLAQLDRA